MTVNDRFERLNGCKFLNDTWLPVIDGRHAFSHYWVKIQRMGEIHVGFMLRNIMNDSVKGFTRRRRISNP